jgi:NAD-dependent DNA ligase
MCAAAKNAEDRNSENRGGENRGVEKKIEALREKIRHHEYLYYVQDQPEIGDSEFDKLMRPGGRASRTAHGRFSHTASRRQAARGLR